MKLNLEIITLANFVYNPQQNGCVERLNGTLINATKVLLNDAKLNHHFWEDAINNANFIHNLLPHKGTNNKIPIYFILFASTIWMTILAHL